jgi:plasmid maintenance system antidote protein VapI
MTPKTHRIEQLIGALTTTEYAFEKKIKASKGSINKTINRGSKITDNLVAKIIKAYPAVNEQWLKTGKGQIFLKQTEGEIQDTDVPYTAIHHIDTLEDILAMKDKLNSIDINQMTLQLMQGFDKRLKKIEEILKIEVRTN